MRLVVLGSPSLTAPKLPQQTVIVKYDPGKQLTIVDCDVDIVTLGLAVNILQAQYEDYLAKLKPADAEIIETTTRKAVKLSEKY